LKYIYLNTYNTLSTINHQPSNINHQTSTIKHQPSTIKQTMDNLQLQFLNCAKQVSEIANRLFSYITVIDYTEFYRSSPNDEEVKKTIAVVVAHDDEILDNLFEDYHNNNHITDDSYDDKCDFCKEQKTRLHFENFVINEIKEKAQ
jgi:hypothetical protein